MTADTEESLQRLSALFSDLQPHLVAAEPAERVLSVLTTRGTRAVPGAEHAGVIRGKNGKFETVAATSELAYLGTVGKPQLPTDAEFTVVHVQSA